MIRLNKYLASTGIGSRRKCDDYILAGRVAVNGKVVHKLGLKIDEESDTVTFDNEKVQLKSAYIYIIINKPKGFISTVNDEHGRRTVLDLIPSTDRVYPVGRLDADTTGLLLLTNDGDLTNKLTHPKYKIPKTYHALLDRIIRPIDAYHFERGIMLDDKKTAPCKLKEIRVIDNCSYLEIIIREGRNRQIRRMFEQLGYEEVELDRIAFGSLMLTGLKRREWRYLTQDEVNGLKRTKTSS